MGKPAQVVETRGIKEFSRELGRLDDGNWRRELARGNKEVGQNVAEWGKEFLARDSHPTQRHVARLKAIRSKQDARRSVVRVDANAKRNAMAIGAVMGSKAYKQFHKYEPVRWGNGIPVTGGSGPFDAIRDRLDDIRETYGRMVDDLTKRAFPKR